MQSLCGEIPTPTNIDSQPALFKCYRCPLKFSTEKEYNTHCFDKHPKLPIHPDRKLLDLEGLEPKGNPWE